MLCSEELVGGVERCAEEDPMQTLIETNTQISTFQRFNTRLLHHLPAPALKTYHHERLIMKGQRRRSGTCSQHFPMTPIFLIPILSAWWTGEVCPRTEGHCMLRVAWRTSAPSPCFGATNCLQVTLETFVIKFKSDPTHGKFVLSPSVQHSAFFSAWSPRINRTSNVSNLKPPKYRLPFVSPESYPLNLIPFSLE